MVDNLEVDIRVLTPTGHSRPDTARESGELRENNIRLESQIEILDKKIDDLDVVEDIFAK